jgi:hypothetical protein
MPPPTDYYEQLMVIQNERCAICGRKWELVVDHDHRTNFIRGLLCRGCNVREAFSDLGCFNWYRVLNPGTGLDWEYGIVDNDTYVINRTSEREVFDAMARLMSD